MVWHTAKEIFDPQCIIPTGNHGGDSVTVCECFTRRRIGRLHILDRTMDRLYYHEILERNLLPFIANFGFSGGFTFIHDNDPEHTSAAVNNCLVKQYKKILLWLSYSPDLNLVEHLWNKLRRRLKKRQLRNRQELGNLLMESGTKLTALYWKNLPIQLLVVSMNVFVSKAIPLSTKLVIRCSLHRITNIFCKMGE